MKNKVKKDHEVKVNIEFRPFSECHVSSSGTVTVPTLTNASLWVDYIYLDTDERRQFAQIAHRIKFYKVKLLVKYKLCRKVTTYKYADTTCRKMCKYSAIVKSQLYCC